MTAVYAQLVASSLRKQSEDTVGYHREGYAWAPKVGFLIPALVPEAYAGWNLPAGQTVTVGNKVGYSQVTALQLKGPNTVRISDWEYVIQYYILPNYTYQLDYLFGITKGYVEFPTIDLPTPNLLRPEEEAAALSQAYRAFNVMPQKFREIVGVNNVCEIRFSWGARDNKRVTHVVHWCDPKTTEVVWTEYVVSLNPNDPKLPDPPITRVP